MMARTTTAGNPLRHPEFQRLWLGLSISYLGDRFTIEVTTSVELIAVEGKKLIFTVSAHDGVHLISKGQHQRIVINSEKFNAKLAAKRVTN